MRFAVFSDVHGNIAALEAVLADIALHDVDHILCLGDLVAMGPHPLQVLSRVRELDCPIVQGNTDAWYKSPIPEGWKPANTLQTIVYDCYLWMRELLSEEEHAYLLSLPFSHQAGPVLAVHGSPRDFQEPMLPDTPENELVEMLAHVPDDVQVVLCGHSHQPMLRRAGQRTVIGVGSVAMCADGEWKPCYALLDQTSDGWQVAWPRVEYDVEKALEAARQASLPHLDAFAQAWTSGKGLTA